MITKNGIYGKTENVVVVELGTGDCHMVMSEKLNNEVHLTLRTTEPNEINSDLPPILEGVTFDDLKPEIAFIFRKVESIDSLIHMLKLCRDEFVS